MKVIASDKAPKALGPYSQAVLVGSTLYMSGQIAINRETGEFVQSSIEAETEQIMHNLEAVLTEAGYGRSVVGGTIMGSFEDSSEMLANTVMKVNAKGGTI